MVEYLITFLGNDYAAVENARRENLLNVAVVQNNLDMCEMLLHYYQFSFTKSIQDRHAIERSIQKGYYQVFELLIEYHIRKNYQSGVVGQLESDVNDFVHLAAINKQCAILKYLVQKGADIDVRDRYK